VDVAERAECCTVTDRATPRQEASASEIVRTAIRESGLSLNELARRSGVEASALSRFVNGMVGLTLTSFEKLAPVLGLRVARRSTRQQRK
jgi:transcriptional regulator with XRE-family HTH domain